MITNSCLVDFKCRLHSDMLLQERLVPNVQPTSVPTHGLWGQAIISCTHRGGHPAGTHGQSSALWAVVPGKVPDRFWGQIPASPCGHQALHPSHGGQHCRRGCFVHWTNTYLGHHRLSEQWSLCRRLVEESPQFRTYEPEFHLPGCGWMATSGPALAAGLGKRHVCRDLPCATEVQWHVPQRLEQWNVCRPVRGWQHAVVLGPDTRRQRRCGLPIPQTSGHGESQSEIRQAPASDHHTDSLCPVQ